MRRTLRSLVWTMGLVCAAIGVYHLTLGISSVPGESGLTGTAAATVDSRERFYAVMFGGYGLAWIWAARQSVLPLPLVRALAWLFWAAGAARLVSWAVEGRPQWFQVVLTVVEVALPPVYLWMARERD